MYQVNYLHFGQIRTDIVDAESYSHAHAIARKIYAESLQSVKRKR